MHKKRMDKRIKRGFQNLRLSGKLLVIYILAGLLPIMITLTITYHEMKKILWDRETMILESYLTQTTDALDNELEIYNNLSNYISYNQSIAKILSSDQSTYQNYEQVASVIDPLLSSIMYFHDDVKQVTIYTDACQVKHGSTIAPITTLENEEENYGMVGDNQIHWIVNAKDKTAYSLNRMAMLEQKKAKGLLYVGVDYDSVFQPFNNETVFDNYGVVIEDAEGNCIFKKSVFTEEKQPYELSEEQFFATVGQKNSGYQFIKWESKASGWKIWIYKPDRLIISSVQPILIIAAAAILVSLMAAIACICIISEFITKRISKLQKKMRNLETGNLGMEIENDSTDEIGDLINGYNSMTKRLDATINEVYRSKIKEKEYEMRALQAQINPHFLYNSLSIINWKALEADQEDISRITLSLSTFYRTALNKGKNILLVRDEIANIKAYLDIQLTMHDDSFDVIYDIDDSILKYETLNLILQPILENAIHHGIDLKQDGRGEIRISGKEDDKDIRFAVSDNGVGMTKEQAELILTADSKGYGVRNVNERIKLYYGAEYAVCIDSEVGRGTTVTIHFPKELHAEIKHS